MRISEDYVYHGSPRQGLFLIRPSDDPGGKSTYVYACHDIDIAALFLGRLGADFTCSIGRDKETGMPFAAERFKGAFEMRYGKKGSIYALLKDYFIKREDGWKEEMVSERAVKVLDELKVDISLSYLEHLCDKGRLLLYYYPARPKFIPEDDSDILEKAVRWAKRKGRDILLKQIDKYHPKLSEEVRKRI